MGSVVQNFHYLRRVNYASLLHKYPMHKIEGVGPMLKIAALFSLAFICTITSAQVTRYHKETTRQTLLNLVNHTPTRLVVEGDPTSEQAKNFLNFYTTHIFPKEREIENLYRKYRSRSLLRDSASQNSKEELEQWTREMDEVLEEDNAITVDAKWTQTILEWGRLAEGLTGHMPEEARQMAKMRALEAFPESAKPKLDELSKLSREWDDAVRNAPSAKDLPQITKAVSETRRRFKLGEITLDEGRKILRDWFNKAGSHFVGYDAVQAKGENLNRIAVLRTELAKSKGYETWADYQLEMNGQGYATEYRGSKNQREFLKKYLSSLKEVQELFFATRLREMGLEERRGEMTNQDVGFLTPPGTELLQPHFPPNKIADIWEKVLIESGFSPESLKQILVDDQFREGKNSVGAYMSPVQMPYNDFAVVDARTLNYKPIVRTRPELKDGLVYIMQSWKGAGWSELRTNFHEGGHSLEHLAKMKYYSTPESYGNLEVPSLTQERFTEDVDVIYENAVLVDGKRPDRRRVCEILNNFGKGEVIQIAFNAALSLFDLELWSIDYTKPGAPTFVEAVERVSKDTAQSSQVFPNIETKVPFFYSNVSTGHFTSGGIRNIGYDFARVGAAMLSEYISDELERVSGRRNWYKQPEYARIFNEKYAANNWQKLFPLNIEEITGRKFSPDTLVAELKSRITNPRTCEK